MALQGRGASLIFRARVRVLRHASVQHALRSLRYRMDSALSDSTSRSACPISSTQHMPYANSHSGNDGALLPATCIFSKLGDEEQELCRGEHE